MVVVPFGVMAEMTQLTHVICTVIIKSFPISTAPDDYSSVSTTMTFNTQGSTEECVVVMLVDDEMDEPDEWLLIRIDGQTGDYSNFQAIVNITISGGPNGGGGSVGMSWHVSFFFECIYIYI